MAKFSEKICCSGQEHPINASSYSNTCSMINANYSKEIYTVEGVWNGICFIEK